MRIKIDSYLIMVKNEDCPMPPEYKLGKGISWTDESRIRCVGCGYYQGLIFNDESRPSKVNCSFMETE
jgi:hypothetical protein